MPNNREIKCVFWLTTAVFALFLLLPMGSLIVESIREGNSFSLSHYTANIFDARFQRAFSNSVWISATAACITTVLAFFLAYTMHHTLVPVRLKKLVRTLTIFPMFLPTLTYGFVIMYSFGKQGLITRMFGEQFMDIYSPSGMMLGYVIYTLPMAFLLINNTFQYVDQNFVVVSKIMGDSPLRTFLTTSVRPLVGTLGAVFVQSFALCFTDFGIPASLGGQFDVVAIHLYNEMLGSVPNLASGASIAVMMLMPAVLSIVLIGYLERYNFRYNKISRHPATRSIIRDSLCGIGALTIIAVIVMTFAVMFIIPFVKSWPYEITWTWQNIARILALPNLTNTYTNTLIVALLSSVVGTTVAFGAALVTARSAISNKAKVLIRSLSLSINAIPGMVLGISYLLIFSDSCLQNTFAILIISNVIHFFTTPYLMGKSSLEKLNKSWENTALLMGDTWFRTLRRIIIPNMATTLLEMFKYLFVNSMITVSAVIFLVGAKTSMMTTQIKSLQHLAKFDEIFVMSLLILITNLAVRALIGRLEQRFNYHQS